jgi:hypothetical protein
MAYSFKIYPIAAILNAHLSHRYGLVFTLSSLAIIKGFAKRLRWGGKTPTVSAFSAKNGFNCS